MLKKETREELLYGGMIKLRQVQCTACYRGYIGTWEISDKEFYLRSVEVMVPGGRTKLPLKPVFPDCKEKVLADWFTGQLTIPIEGSKGMMHLFVIKNGEVISIQKVPESRRTQYRHRPPSIKKP